MKSACCLRNKRVPLTAADGTAPSNPLALQAHTSSRQNVSMGVLVQVRDVDAQVRDRLKASAAAEGLSLNAYLVRLLNREASTPTRQEVLARIAERSERSDISSVELIRAGRKRL